MDKDLMVKYLNKMTERENNETVKAIGVITPFISTTLPHEWDHTFYGKEDKNPVIFVPVRIPTNIVKVVDALGKVYNKEELLQHLGTFLVELGASTAALDETQTKALKKISKHMFDNMDNSDKEE